jgi:hypothetical protein
MKDGQWRDETLPFNVNVKIQKKSDDPDGCIRVSTGGGETEGGYYVVYRGSKEEAIKCLESCLGAIKAMARKIGTQELAIEPDEGKKYA